MLHRIYIVLLASAAFYTSARAADLVAGNNAPPSPATTLESFRIILERNIFNQNRSPRTAARDEGRARPAPVVQALSLVGTMSFEKGDFAFFDGTNPEYKKPLQEGDKIAGYEVKEINPSCVKIANATNQFEIKVGQQLRREGEGEWQLSTSREPVRAVSGDATAQSYRDTTAGSSGSEDEALKRLMEKRAKELNQ